MAPFGILLGALTAFITPTASAGFGGGGCGTSCFMTLNQNALAPFGGFPMTPQIAPYYGPQIGQMTWYGDYSRYGYGAGRMPGYIVTNPYDWNGWQPLGIGSTMSPIGGSAIINQLLYRQRFGGAAF